MATNGGHAVRMTRTAPPRRALLAGLAALLPASALAAGGGSGKQESYLRLPAVAAGVAVAGGRRGVITVEIGIDTPDPALRARAEQMMPRLRAGWFQTLSAFAAAMRPAALPDADRLARALQAETDRQLGKPGARVLIGSILVN